MTISHPVTVRRATAADIDGLALLVFDYETDYVWQMSFDESERNTTVDFRQVRLPRTLAVPSPISLNQLGQTWQQRRLVIAAERLGRVVGFLAIAQAPMPDVGWISELGVDRVARGQGIGTALMSAALEWSAGVGLRRLVVETQTRNYPAIRFCKRHGFVFSGYNDQYYANHDIALFFSRSLVGAVNKRP